MHPPRVKARKPIHPSLVQRSPIMMGFLASKINVTTSSEVNSSSSLILSHAPSMVADSDTNYSNLAVPNHCPCHPSSSGLVPHILSQTRTPNPSIPSLLILVISCRKTRANALLLSSYSVVRHVINGTSRSRGVSFSL